MLKTIVFVMTLLICSLSFAQKDSFYTIDEFKSAYPEQVSKMDDFSQIIRNQPQPINSKKKIKITFIYPGVQLSDYWYRSIKSFKKRMDLLSINYEIKEYFTQVGQHRKQTLDIKNALKDEPDYLVFTLDIKKHRKLIGKVLSESKTKVILQNITTPLRAWKNKQPLLYVGFDHIEGSKLLADYYKKVTGNTGAYSVFFFQNGYVTQMRGFEFIKYLDKNSKLKLTSSFYTDGKFEKAKKGALKLLSSPNRPKFIYACATDVALGVIAATKELKLKRPPLINGWGGGSKELEAILAGDMDVTVMRMNDDNGIAMAEAIKLDLIGKESQVPTVYSGDFVLVKKGITLKKLDELKQRAFRYSGYNK